MNKQTHTQTNRHTHGQIDQKADALKKTLIKKKVYLNMIWQKDSYNASLIKLF